MYFLNEYEIEMYVQKHRNHPVLNEASRFLFRFMILVNKNSDGWCYWKAPVNASKKLMELVAKNDNPSMEDFKKSLTPIKSFCTKHKLKFPQEG